MGKLKEERALAPMPTSPHFGEVKFMKLRVIAPVILLTTNIAVPAIAENPTQTLQLLSKKQCPQCELSGAGLTMADLSGANLNSADLQRANLSRANLSGADLRNTNLRGASLYGANLMGADLTGADLTGADLRDTYLVNANLVGVNINTAYLQGAIGIPSYAGTPEDFYRWAVAESQKGNDLGAIEHYNRVLASQSDFAPAYLGRGLSRYRLGDEAGAVQDVKTASKLFSTQGNAQGYQAAENFIKGVEIARQPPKKESGGGGGGFLNFLGGVGALLLQLLL
jgi:hypothetical protein